MKRARDDDKKRECKKWKTSKHGEGGGDLKVVAVGFEVVLGRVLVGTGDGHELADGVVASRLHSWGGVLGGAAAPRLRVSFFLLVLTHGDPSSLQFLAGCSASRKTLKFTFQTISCAFYNAPYFFL
jgi:hypothetical protein